jgi:hypothetical protein
MTKKLELSVATALSQMSPAAHLQANDDVAGQLAKLVQVVQGLDQKGALIASKLSQPDPTTALYEQVSKLEQGLSEFQQRMDGLSELELSTETFASFHSSTGS